MATALQKQRKKQIEQLLRSNGFGRKSTVQLSHFGLILIRYMDWSTGGAVQSLLTRTGFQDVRLGHERESRKPGKFKIAISSRNPSWQIRR